MKILNRKAFHDYHMLQTYVAGIILTGSEVKSLREGKANINDAHIVIMDNEVFIKNMFIDKYKEANINNHEEKADRKLLLNKKEIKKLVKDVQNNGITIIPLEIFLLKGRFKMKIAVAKGKKLYDKRESKKEKDIERDTQRELASK